MLAWFLGNIHKIVLHFIYYFQEEILPNKEEKFLVDSTEIAQFSLSTLTDILRLSPHFLKLSP
jgi:hypothetical protein